MLKGTTPLNDTLLFCVYPVKSRLYRWPPNISGSACRWCSLIEWSCQEWQLNIMNCFHCNVVPSVLCVWCKVLVNLFVVIDFLTTVVVSENLIHQIRARRSPVVAKSVNASVIGYKFITNSMARHFWCPTSFNHVWNVSMITRTYRCTRLITVSFCQKDFFTTKHILLTVTQPVWHEYGASGFYCS